MTKATMPRTTLDRYIVAARDAARKRIQCERAGAEYEGWKLDQIWGDNLFYRLFTGKITQAEYQTALNNVATFTADLATEFGPSEGEAADGA